MNCPSIRCVSNLLLAFALLAIAAGVSRSMGADDNKPDQPADEKPDAPDKPEKTNKPKKEPTQLPNDKKLIALHTDFIKKAEKLAAEYEHGKQSDKAVIVYEQILKLVPEYDHAQQQLDRLLAREANSGHKTFEVLASKDWQDTGVRVIAGKPLKLAASGEWTFNMSHKLGPEGMEIPKVLKDFKLGSLIGIIADPTAKAPKPFYIGAGKDFVAEQSGPLLVRMHDSDPSDNRGSLMLEIVGRFDSK
jgi:hypothetical protein